MPTIKPRHIVTKLFSHFLSQMPLDFFTCDFSQWLNHNSSLDLRRILPKLKLKNNCLISKQVKFNSAENTGLTGWKLKSGLVEKTKPNWSGFLFLLIEDGFGQNTVHIIIPKWMQFLRQSKESCFRWHRMNVIRGSMGGQS